MPRILILEGPDGGGKSFLAARLHDTYGYGIVKTGPPAPGVDVTVAYLNALTAAITRPTPTVFDRLHLGEAIYGPLLRGVDRMGPDGLTAMESAIAFSGARLVIVCPSWDVLIEGWRSKEDLLKTETELRTVYDAYLAHAARLGVKPYDWTTATEKALKELIAE